MKVEFGKVRGTLSTCGDVELVSQSSQEEKSLPVNASVTTRTEGSPRWAAAHVAHVAEEVWPRLLPLLHLICHGQIWTAERFPSRLLMLSVLEY